MALKNLIEYLQKEKPRTIKILALLSAASVLRKEGILREILSHLKK